MARKSSKERKRNKRKVARKKLGGIVGSHKLVAYELGQIDLDQLFKHIEATERPKAEQLLKTLEAA